MSAFPPTNIDGALVPSSDVEHEATLAGAGRGAGMSMVDPRAWYAKQRAIITAEMHKEYREMQEKLLERFKLQMERVHLELEREKVKGMEAIQLKKEIRMKEEMEYRAKVGK